MSSATAPSGLGAHPPSFTIPGVRLTPRPKGAETHPGDGRLSVGNASLPLLRIYHAWHPYLAYVAGLTEVNSRIRSLSAGNASQPPLISIPSRFRFPVRGPHRQLRCHSRAPCGRNRCPTRPSKNLSQVLENMDPGREKSTLQLQKLHFVKVDQVRTSPPIEKTTRVDSVKQLRAGQGCGRQWVLALSPAWAIARPCARNRPRQRVSQLREPHFRRSSQL